MPPDRDRSRRRAMVATQIAARGVGHRRVLAALARVPRHFFVPPSLEHAAYDDAPLPVGQGQTISQPYIVALMTAALRPRRTHRVLEIGTGTGYQAAVLAHLVARVYTIERLAPLAAAARARLAGLGCRNIEYRVGDGSAGWPEAAPFDGILVTAAAPAVPAPLLDQLAVGGRLVVPVGGLGFQVLTLVERAADGLREWTEGACRFVPLIGAHAFPEIP